MNVCVIGNLAVLRMMEPVVPSFVDLVNALRRGRDVLRDAAADFAGLSPAPLFRDRPQDREDPIEQRIRAQWTVEEKMARSNYVIWTETSLEIHAAQLARILRQQ